MEISAKLIKELRERTSAGILDCKKALQECNADLEAAIDWLRQKGLAKAAGKAGRATSEGIVAHKISATNDEACLVEVMCETDFVSRGDKFRAFAQSVADLVYDNKPKDQDALTALLGDRVNAEIATLGENMSVGKFANMKVTGTGLLGCYIHSTGKIGVLVEISCSKPETARSAAVLALAKDVAMQIAANNPAAIDSSSIDPALVEREREVFRQKTLDEGKPANIVDKIVDGRIKKFYEEVCLVEQAYLRDDKMKISDVINNASKEAGDTLSIKQYVRLQLGEKSE